MSTKSKRELLTTVSPRYVTASGTERQRILDEFVATTGYHRKYAITLLRHPPPPRRRPITRPREKRYTPVVQRTLVRLWEIGGRICSKRLVPGLPDLIDALERHGELTLDVPTRTLLCALSPATTDRLLAPTRRAALPRGHTTTKPGSLLKHQVPLRTFADWDDAQPGFFEIDLVAHGGESSSGEYLHSLVLTDIATQWTECIALRNRGEQAVCTAIARVRTLLPVPLLGLDSDNGGEFINHLLVRYCEREQITFTRCRPYKKNDQCHVEQKNYSIVRQIVGYDRYEGEDAHEALTALYLPLRRYTNYFQPSVRLVSKQREGAKVTKRYDVAQTPYQRMLATKEVADEVKACLHDDYLPLNPAAIRREIEAAQDALWRLTRVRNTREATTPSE
ncbi:MAG: ISNCY family transposase [Chloroflexota bacterium]|nr:ISNCY family transposase [Chloroflexota bacterium]